MPVREFNGELDKPKVRPFTDKLDQAPRMGPRPRRFEGSPNKALRPSREEIASALPLVGGIVGTLAGPAGTGLGALALGSLGAMAGSATGELSRQAILDEEIDPGKALKVGAVEGAGNLVGGTALKVIGALSGKIFARPLSGPQQAAAEFAKGKDAPFPLSSAASGSPGGRVAGLSRAGLLGEFRSGADATRVAQFLNREVGTITAAAKPADDAALAGQRYLAELFDERRAITKTMSGFKDAVGETTRIDIPATQEALKIVMRRLTESGQARGEGARSIKQILRSQSAIPDQLAQLDTAQLDDLLGTTFKNLRGPNRHILEKAIVKDIDTFGKARGLKFAEGFEKAKKDFSSFKELRNIEGLERLSQDVKNPQGWLNSLFASPNGAALAKFRELNPVLYHDLADSWVASNISKFSQPTEGAMGSILNGTRFRAWFETNESALKTILGKPQVQALDNFSLYASFMTKAVSRADKLVEPTLMLGRGAAVAAAATQAPFIVGMSEAASFVLARGLADPTSSLFRLFTSGVKPATRRMWLQAGGIAGQAEARRRDENTR